MAELILDENEIEELLIEVVTGKRMFETESGEVLAVVFPTMRIKDNARIIYTKKLKELVLQGLPRKEQMREMIRKYEMLPPDFEFRKNNIKGLLKEQQTIRDITASKIQLAEIKHTIDQLNYQLMSLELQEMVLFDNSAESLADKVKLEYIISRCLLKGDELDIPYWNVYNDFQKDSNKSLINSAKKCYNILTRGVPSSKIRALARSEEWKRRWKTSKQTGTNVFDGASSIWDINKVNICYWSDFYDSIYGYKDPPNETIINDDDKLFEWIRNVNRINSIESKTNNGSKGELAKKIRTPYKIRPKNKQG